VNEDILFQFITKRIVSFASGSFTKSTENETQLKEEIKLKIIQMPTE
jgi:hypothetical protein